MEGHGQVPALLGDHAESGLRVAPPRCTFLVLSSIHTSTYRVFSLMVSTVRKSHAKIPAAWWWRNSLHVGPRLGAGPSPARLSTVAIVVADPSGGHLALGRRGTFGLSVIPDGHYLIVHDELPTVPVFGFRAFGGGVVGLQRMFAWASVWWKAAGSSSPRTRG
jgi:hypothetical protein